MVIREEEQHRPMGVALLMQEAEPSRAVGLVVDELCTWRRRLSAIKIRVVRLGRKVWSRHDDAERGKL